jgi:hypothetical protein
MDKALDKENNLDLVISMLPNEDSGFSLFQLLEFDRLRRRLQNTVLRVHHIVNVFDLQVRLMGREFHRKFLDNLVVNVLSVVGRKPQPGFENDPNITFALLEDGVRLGKEILGFSELWTGYAAD